MVTVRLLRAWPALLAVAGAACGIPRDPRGTLDRVRGGTIRVGVAERAPWVVLGRSEPTGTEPRLLRTFARGLGARITWTPGAESELMEALERGELDVVAGGITRSTAWRERVALTRPYRPTGAAHGPSGPVSRHVGEHVMAVPPGENGWLRALEASLDAGAVTPAGASGGASGAATGRAP